MHENLHECFEKQIKKYDHKKAKESFQTFLMTHVCPWGLKELIEYHIEELNIVDIRCYEDYTDGHIPFATHIPFESLENYMDMFHKDKMNIVYCACQSCMLSHKAALLLADKDYPVKVLLGGFKGWHKAGFDVVKTSANDDQ